MTIFDLKIIACISMIIDHIKYAIPATSGTVTLYLGRLAFPLFCFVAVQGYLHTSNFKKYLQRLAIFGIISQIPFMLFLQLVTSNFEINVMLTLLMGLVAISFVDKIDNKFLGYTGCFVIILASFFIPVDYHWFGVILMVLMFLTKNNKFVFTFFYIILVFAYFFIDYIKFNLSLFTYYFPYIVCTILPIIFMLMYNGKLGKKIKYFYYWFYPAHLLIFYFISKFV